MATRSLPWHRELAGCLWGTLQLLCLPLCIGLELLDWGGAYLWDLMAGVEERLCGIVQEGR